MKSILLALILLGVSQSGVGVMHPTLNNPRIVSCSGSLCMRDVMYQADGSSFVDIIPQGNPDPAGGTVLKAMGIHCSIGASYPPGGERPFAGCDFRVNEHAPLVTNCNLVSTDGWELTPDSTCGIATSWGAHSGAGPGGECVFFVNAVTDLVKGPLHTVLGVVTAQDVANSGNSFCQKPLPPDVSCDVLLPATIDHGTVGPDSSSSISVSGQVSCGDNPVISFLGGDRLNLAPGVTTVLTARSIGPDQIQITSDLVTLGGAIGDHSASTVIIVSPY
ncbi:Uncharacterised protein [Serratia fonticola]|nr:Uncharacterised protein [Serratia fonticola]